LNGLAQDWHAEDLSVVRRIAKGLNALALIIPPKAVPVWFPVWGRFLPWCRGSPYGQEKCFLIRFRRSVIPIH
jgi:hypothetical protein